MKIKKILILDRSSSKTLGSRSMVLFIFVLTLTKFDLSYNMIEKMNNSFPKISLFQEKKIVYVEFFKSETLKSITMLCYSLHT